MMAAEALSRRQPQKATRAETEAQETRRALQWAKDKLRHEGYPRATLGQAVWRLLQDYADTENRMPDKEKAWLRSGDSAMWPMIHHSYQERFEAEAQRLVELRESPTLPALPKLSITDPGAIPRMMTVNVWLHSFVKARDYKLVARNKEVIRLFALGGQFMRIRYLMGGDKTDRRAYGVRKEVLDAICNGVRKYWRND